MRTPPAYVGALLLLAACGGPAPGPPTTGVSTAPILFDGARLIVGDGTVIENGAFLVDGGTIVRVGRAGEVAAPAGSRRVDLAGRTVIPALIDAHAHLGFECYTSWGGGNYTRENVLDHLERYARYGFGAVFSAGTDPPEIARGIQAVQAAGEVGGARLVFAVGMAPPGQGPNARMLEAVEALGDGIVRGAGTPEEARAAVRAAAAIPVPFVKIWVDDRNGTQVKMPPEVYRAIVDEARRLGIRVVAHQQDAADTRALVDAGVDGFLHGRLGPDLDDGLAAAIARAGAFVVPNLGLSERGRHGELEDPFLLESFDAAVVERLGETFAPRPPLPESRERELHAAFRRLLDHGVDVVLGTDAGAVPDHFFGYSGHVELEIFVRLGMTPMQAIVAATSRPAERLGLADAGTLEAGKRADFVVLDANPLDDIRNTRRIAEVWLRGERVER